MSEIAAAYAPPILGEVRFRRHGDQLCVDRATSVMWFALYLLKGSRSTPDVGLSYDGDLVTLRAANGTWVWKLTGRRCSHRWSTDGETFDMVEGIWPD